MCDRLGCICLPRVCAGVRRKVEDRGWMQGCVVCVWVREDREGGGGTDSADTVRHRAGRSTWKRRFLLSPSHTLMTPSPPPVANVP